MQLKSIRVQNYKGLKDVTVPLSQFGCLIGENNSGKSSVLQAILLALPSSSKKPSTTEFYDSRQPIRIELLINDIGEADLARIANDQHRASFATHVASGSVRFVRLIESGAQIKSQLLISRLMPADERWTDSVIQSLMKGKSGPELRAAIVDLLPELDHELKPKPTQKDVIALRDEAVAAMAIEDMVYRDEPLATGLDAGIKNFLPEPIYIEAVKNVADEVKTSETATFGKLLAILLDEVQDQFADVEAKFRSIQRQLSRVVGEDGEIVDERISEVRAVETMINNFVRESFPDVGLTISVPVPKMKTILSSAEIEANDGHTGPIVSKGDGLKRAVAFAILRAYTALRSSGIGGSSGLQGHYWLLFEEPELYLYPRAQRQLFNALDTFSKDYPVLVATHSPAFFDAESTQTFVKFTKISSESGESPHTQVHPVVFQDDLPAKTAFQIICHENNSIGFFAKEVVLVEGDSDALLLPHLAKILSDDWDSVERDIAFVRTNGKGNIGHYRTFFSKFNTQVHVICDLDALVSGFEKLEPSDEARLSHRELFSLIDASLNPEIDLTEGKAKKLVTDGEARALWRNVESARDRLDGSDAKADELQRAVETFFSFRRKDDRLEALKNAGGQILGAKQDLLEILRGNRTHVLSRGAIEEYYASGSKFRDKVRQAMAYRSECTSVEKYRQDLGPDGASVEAELRQIMNTIFAPSERDKSDSGEVFSV